MTPDPDEVVVRGATPDEVAWVADRLVASWGSVQAARRGRLIDASALPALVATVGERRVGLATYRVDTDVCELVTIDAFEHGMGVGAALVDAVAEQARTVGCRRMWLITTNDNTPALRFYQQQGFRLVALHRDAVEESRRLKPQISATGLDGIPLRDELELELDL